MSAPIDWEEIPEGEYEGYRKRLQIVELLLDDSIDGASKKSLREQFHRDNGVSERTVANWLARYLKEGPAGLMFRHRHRPRSPRVADEQLRTRILSLVRELPSRSVATLRRLLRADPTCTEAICQVSNRSIYRLLQDNGLGHSQRRAMLGGIAQKAYHSFEAPHSLALVQGDARDGIWLDLPDGSHKKTYLFVWLDDFSRKILFGKYYLDEKLPCLEDSFKYMVLRWGIPLAAYMDNGSVYISRQFASVLAELRIKGLHHKPYQAHAKGKIEALQKTVKNEFQSEAARAGIRTVEELNSAFWAWAEVEYNTRLHSSTGQAPDERFLQGLPKDHRRVEDLGKFQAMFLWKAKRTVSKWGKISLYANPYPVQMRAPGAVVQVRYDPFDLSEVLIYDPDTTNPLETSTPTKQVNTRAPNVPEESRKTQREISQQSLAYFTRLRERYLQSQKKTQEVSFQTLKDHPEEAPHA
jgi:transposase InsO family protein